MQTKYIGSVPVSASTPKIVTCIESVDEANYICNDKETREATDIVELQVDRFNTGYPHQTSQETKEIVNVLEDADLPIIGVIRRTLDGGAFPPFNDSELLRKDIFQGIADCVDAIDIEYGTKTGFDDLGEDIEPKRIYDDVITMAEAHDLTTIISYHSDETPEKETICNLMGDMHDLDEPDILKLTFRAETRRDIIPVQEALDEYITSDEYIKPISTISRGEEGEMSRATLPLVGSALTYGYIEGYDKKAPGQLPVNVLDRYLRNAESDLESIPVKQTANEEAQKTLSKKMREAKNQLYKP